MTNYVCNMPEEIAADHWKKLQSGSYETRVIELSFWTGVCMGQDYRTDEYTDASFLLDIALIHFQRTPL